MVATHNHTEAQMLASVLAGTGTTKYTGVMRPVLARLPEAFIADIDAMAKLTDKSRSAMVVHLIAVALQEVRRASDANTLKKIDKESFIALQAFEQSSEERETGEA